MIGFDFTVCRNDPKTNRSWVGRYRVEGEQISIAWQDFPHNRTLICRKYGIAPSTETYQSCKLDLIDIQRRESERWAGDAEFD